MLNRLLQLLVVLSLGLTLVTGPAAPSVLADEEDKDRSAETEEENPALTSPRVEGIVYKIREIEGNKVVTVYFKDVGFGVDVFVKPAHLVALIDNKSVCIGRFIVAEGIRLSQTQLEAQGIMPDMSTSCGEPPK